MTPREPIAGDGRRPAVLVVTPSVVATFSRQDLHLLSEEFDATLYADAGLRRVAELGKQIASTDAVLIWFAGRHSVPAVWQARRLGKPVITIIGGYEAQWIPELQYGIRPASFRHRALAWVLKHSDRILTVSTITDTGIKEKVPGISEKCRLVYNAVDTDLFTPGESQARTGVICVGQITEQTMDVKGWRFYWELARRMPDVAFNAIGPADSTARAELIEHRPANLTWIDETAPRDLVGYYQKSAVYVQASVHESFSLSLAEAMACGCIPVTTRRGALPEVAGETGYFIDRDDPSIATEQIRSALTSGRDRRAQVRQWVVEHFPLARRRDALSAVIREVLAAHQ